MKITRGKIIYIAENTQVYSTIEFNGDMYPVDGGHGEEIIDSFLKWGIWNRSSYENYVKRMDERYFGYASEYEQELIYCKGLYRDDLLDFTENYTDYLYLINHAGRDIQIIMKDGKDVTKVVMRMHHAVRDDLLQYLESSLKAEE